MRLDFTHNLQSAIIHVPRASIVDSILIYHKNILSYIRPLGKSTISNWLSSLPCVQLGKMTHTLALIRDFLRFRLIIEHLAEDWDFLAFEFPSSAQQHQLEHAFVTGDVVPVEWD